MAKLDPASTALVLVDIQKGFDHPTHWGASRSTPQFEENVGKLLSAFRSLKEKKHGRQDPEQAPLIVHIYHQSLNQESPLHPDNGDGMSFLPFAEPQAGERVISKHVNSAFIGTKLEEVLRDAEIRQLVVCGLTTDHCVSTTVRMAANLGVTDGVDKKTEERESGRVILVEDATATFGKGGWDAGTVHEVHVASLRGEFAEVLSTEEVIGMLI